MISILRQFFEEFLPDALLQVLFAVAPWWVEALAGGILIAMIIQGVVKALAIMASEAWKEQQAWGIIKLFGGIAFVLLGVVLIIISLVALQYAIASLIGRTLGYVGVILAGFASLFLCVQLGVFRGRLKVMMKANPRKQIGIQILHFLLLPIVVLLGCSIPASGIAFIVMIFNGPPPYR